MSTEHLIVLSIPGLRTRDVTPVETPTLHRWAADGALTELVPTFPCVTSPVQATMWTGRPPGEHGVIANGFFFRERQEVEFWVARNDVIGGEQVWEALRQQRPDMTSAVWHAQNIKAAAADFIVTPAPIHEPDGTTRLWCYSKPDGLYQQLIDEIGHFPLQHYWGPLAGIESTRWILGGASWLIDQHAPNLHWIYLPHLDYASQKFGPDSKEAHAALVELDAEISGFADRTARSAIGDGVTYLVAGEYALTDVTGVVYPNRILRAANLLAIREDAGREHVDLERSAAFAMVDHQFAHVYIQRRDPSAVQRVVEAFRDVPGVAVALAGDSRRAAGLMHERSGDVILVSDDAHWFAYYWWLDDAAAPPFARTVDIHSKPGYDPVELFFDPATRSIPLDATLVKGSHGAAATGPQHRTALICSARSEVVQPGKSYCDADLKGMALSLLSVR